MLCIKACFELEKKALVVKHCHELFCKRGGGWLSQCVVKPHAACLDRPLGGGSHCGLFPLNSCRSSHRRPLIGLRRLRTAGPGRATQAVPIATRGLQRTLCLVHVGQIASYPCGQEHGSISGSSLHSLLHKFDRYKIKRATCILKEV